MLGKVLSNRAVLGMLVVLLGGWRVYDWWWREDVCAARYHRADRHFKKQTARKNGKISRFIDDDLLLDQKSMSNRARQNHQTDKNLDWYKDKTDAVLPKSIHGAIQKVR